MEQETTLKEQEMYHNYAEIYNSTKKESIMNILTCGKILLEARENMAWGMWGSFLTDTRVSESPRTAQRLITIYKNYRHLLNKPTDKTKYLVHLGMSHLLELQKLPDRFKKEIEIVTKDGNKESREKAKVVDEEKLSEFLEQNVMYNGKQQAMRELPVTEMRKYINEEKGIFDKKPPQDPDEPEKKVIDVKPIKTQTPNQPKVKPTSEVELNGITNIFSEVTELLVKMKIVLINMNDRIDKIDRVLISELTEPQVLAIHESLKTTHLESKKYVENVEKCLKLFQ